MLQRIRSLPSEVDGFRAVGEVTRDDYRQVLEPVLEEARREDRRLKLLFELGDDFEGYGRGAVWEDARIGFRYLRRFDRCAILTDVEWITKGARFFSTLLPFPVRTYPSSQRAEALDWLASPVARSRIRRRLIEDKGVLELEVDGSLRAEDFDAIAVTVDPWIEARGTLAGIVICAPKFPGWENLSSFLAHLRFIRDHHRRVRRIAVVTEGRVTEKLPGIIEPFVEAEIRAFETKERARATEWAASGALGARSAS